MFTHVSEIPLIKYLASERAAVDYCNEVVDGSGRLQHLDRVLSVSAFDPIRANLWLPAAEMEEQGRRHLHVCDELHEV